MNRVNGNAQKNKEGKNSGLNKKKPEKKALIRERTKKGRN